MKYFIFIKSYFFLCILCLVLCSTFTYADEYKIKISGVHCNIGKDVKLTFSSDLEVTESVSWLNNGSVLFDSSSVSNISFNAKDSEASSGNTFFYGNGTISLLSSSLAAGFQNLDLNCNVNLLSSFNVFNSLTLKNTIVNIQNADNALSLLNEKPSSLLTDEKSYISGFFERKVNKSLGIYKYPIGSSIGKNDVCVCEIDVDDNLKIRFNTSLMPKHADDSNTISSRGGWEVNSKQTWDDNASFVALFNVSNIVCEADFSTSYVECGSIDSSNCSCMGMSSESTFPIFKTRQKIGKGFFIPVNSSEPLDVKIVNSIKVGNGYENIIVKTIADNVTLSELLVFDQLGNIVYAVDNYVRGTFDASRLPKGTYYYSLKYFYNEKPNEIFQIKEFLKILYK